VTFEIFMAFGVFGIVGFLGLHPDTTIMGGSYDIGFITFPSALEALPASNFWSAIWFLTLLVLGVSSAFAMLDAVITLLLDANPRFKRIWVVTGLVITCYLVSLPFCTKFGYHLLNAVDAWVNNLALVFVVWAEAVAATSAYRWKDVAGQVGAPAFIVYNGGYFSGMVLGVVLGHAVAPAAGAGLGFGLFVSGTAIALCIAKTPNVIAPRVFGHNVWLNKAYYLAFYQVPILSLFWTVRLSIRRATNSATT
jgi:solute carrier family 6 GABA transporter-like protein 1